MQNQPTQPTQPTQKSEKTPLQVVVRLVLPEKQIFNFQRQPTHNLHNLHKLLP